MTIEIKQKINDYCNNVGYNGFKYVDTKFRGYLLVNWPDRIADVKFPTNKGDIAGFLIRCNKPVSFNNEIRNNDLEFVLEITDTDETSWSTLTHVYNITTDPSVPKSNIAHFAQQIYAGNIGYHHGDSDRICIRSDKGCWYFRTDSNEEIVHLGKKVDEFAVFGARGLNNHNANGFRNSSEGCAIIDPDHEKDQYQDDFKPLLTAVKNNPTAVHNNIPMYVIDEDFWNTFDFNPDSANKATNSN